VPQGKAFCTKSCKRLQPSEPRYNVHAASACICG
jgi:hypothetical protein